MKKRIEAIFTGSFIILIIIMFGFALKNIISFPVAQHIFENQEKRFLVAMNLAKYTEEDSQMDERQSKYFEISRDMFVDYNLNKEQRVQLKELSYNSDFTLSEEELLKEMGMEKEYKERQVHLQIIDNTMNKFNLTEDEKTIVKDNFLNKTRETDFLFEMSISPLSSFANIEGEIETEIIKLKGIEYTTAQINK